MALVIHSREVDCLPISWRGFHPATLAGATRGEVERKLLLHGNCQVAAGELFRFQGDTRDGVWHLEGDFSSVHYIAADMEEGEIVAAGPVGRHAGSGMRGGRLRLSQASDYLGVEMRGGRIEVTGNAGDYVGGAYVGAKQGMRGGIIAVEGSVGSHAGAAMRRGVLVVKGDCGPWVGYRMRGGTIVIGGRCGDRPGAELRRGTIIAAGSSPDPLPTFRFACRYRPSVLDTLQRELAAIEIEVPYPPGALFDLYNGDLNEGGRGELLVL